MSKERHYTLTASCPDRVGLVAKVASFIAEHGGWILETNLHAEPPGPLAPSGRFFMRFEIRADSIPLLLTELRERFAPLAESLEMDWRISDSAVKKRVVILVSRQEHCLYDLLSRWHSGELDVEIPCVISNHEDLRGFVEWHGIPFLHVPVTPDNRPAAFAEIRRLFEEVGGDVMVLARYMQILPPELCRAYPARIINIHHSFLPSFVGARPYHQAWERGGETHRGYLPLRHRGARPRADHRAGRHPRRSFGYGGRHGALRQGHREDGALARVALSPRGSGVGPRQQNHRVSLSSASGAGFVPRGLTQGGGFTAE